MEDVPRRFNRFYVQGSSDDHMHGLMAALRDGNAVGSCILAAVARDPRG